METIKQTVTSMFSDREWDADITKITGFALICVGVVGFFMQKENFQWLMTFGAGLLATGKFSKEG